MIETRCNKTRRRRYYLKIPGIIVTVLIALNTLLSGTALAKTITVDANGSGDFISIQDAIDNSMDYEEIDGELYQYYPSDLTIIVYPGVYHESVKTLFPLKLIAYSPNPSDTIIESEEYAITLQISDSYYGEYEYLISGFTINGADAGIHDSMQYASSLTIENNVITGGHNGVILSTEMPTIKNNKFIGNEYGISLDDSGPVNIIGNEFVDNNQGINIMHSNADIKDNLFANNTRAVCAEDCGIKITHNAIRDNTEGISLNVCVGTLIASNVITGNTEYGVSCFSIGGSQVYNNVFNNEINVVGYDYILNIEACEGPNIVGGPYIGGNFWGKPDGTGFSQICPDTDLDGFCDEPYIIHMDDFSETVDYIPLKQKVFSPEPEPPIANFSINVTSGYAPLSVQFTDLSENATEWNWDFGDGSNSKEQNPLHTYSASGNYTVNLTAGNVNGTNSKLAAITVLVKSESVLPVADFSTSVTGGYAPLSVTFTDLSQNATSRSWDVNGDGIEDSNASSFVYEYASAGTYTAKLTAINSKGTDLKTAIVTVLERPVPPVANFSASPITGKVPLTVTFIDKNIGSPTSWSWNFGDKTTSIDQSPVHTYSKAGKYTVSLTVKNALGSNTKKITKYIVVTNK